MGLLSGAQIVGYLALVLGVAAFLQKSDRRLKLLLSVESFVYAAHFTLLDNPTAAVSALISGGRTLAALRWQSPLLAAAVILVNVLSGVYLSHSAAGWLPVIASCAATLAFFFMRGIPMRLVLLSSTLMWLANNILCRSYGGVVLESLIALTNAFTILRMIEPGFLPWNRRIVD